MSRWSSPTTATSAARTATPAKSSAQRWQTIRVAFAPTVGAVPGNHRASVEDRVMRTPRAVGSSRPRYPRLRAAWGLLVGVAPIALAAPAFADATLPENGQGKSNAGQGSGEHPAPLPQVKFRLGGDIAYVEPPRPPRTEKRPPSPLQQRKVAKPLPLPGKAIPAPAPMKGVPHAPAVRGGPPRPRPEPPQLPGGVARPSLPLSPARAGFSALARPMVLHCHGPDEPCRPIAERVMVISMGRSRSDS